MKENIDILLGKLKADDITHGGTEQDYIDEYGVYGTITDAMKEAQIEVLKELSNKEFYWIMGISEENRSVYNAIQTTIKSFIKELES